jgi:hypothetical protein
MVSSHDPTISSLLSRFERRLEEHAELAREVEWLKMICLVIRIRPQARPQLIRRILILRQALFILTISLSRSRSVLICGSNYIRFVERATSKSISPYSAYTRIISAETRAPFATWIADAYIPT